jgi:hypothetical protein
LRRFLGRSRVVERPTVSLVQFDLCGAIELVRTVPLFNRRVEIEAGVDPRVFGRRTGRAGEQRDGREAWKLPDQDSRL